MTSGVDERVWEGVRHRRTPDRWVVLVAVAAGATLVGVSVLAVVGGFTSPRLSSSTWTANEDPRTSTATFRIDVSNSGARPVEVVGARVVDAEGATSAGVVSVTTDAVTVPPGDTTTVVTMRVRLGCSAVVTTPSMSIGRGPATIVLDTTGTWPGHSAEIGDANLDDLCAKSG